MIAPAGDVKVVVATQPVDFRRGINGLVALVASALAADPYLCVGRGYVAEPSWRQPEPAQSGIFRFRTSPMGAGFPCATIPEGQYARVLFFVWWGAQAPA